MNKETQAIIWANAFAINGDKHTTRDARIVADGVLEEAIDKYNSL